jgi:rRNA maturation endonuclease Nob1
MYAIPDTYEYYAYKRYLCSKCKTEWHSEHCQTCGVNLELHGEVK